MSRARRRLGRPFANRAQRFTHSVEDDRASYMHPERYGLYYRGGDLVQVKRLQMATYSHRLTPAITPQLPHQDQRYAKPSAGAYSGRKVLLLRPLILHC